MPKRSDLEKWNDAMYLVHPTPYQNKIAGIIERQRVKAICKLARASNKDSVLEIGCEQGVLLEKFLNTKRVIGVDISQMALKDAKRRLGAKAKLIQADAEKQLKIPGDLFEIIICSQMLEHVKSPKKVINNIWRLAKNNGRIIMSVPNELHLLKMKNILKSLGLLQWLFPGIEEKVSEWHLQVFTDKKFRKLIKNKFTIEKTMRIFGVYLVYLLKKEED